jgi:DNA-binding response OmpR family regulator
MIVQCPKCLKRYRLAEAKASLVRVHCKACGHGFLVSLAKLPSHELAGAGRGFKALVADIQSELRNQVVEILKRAEFHLFIAEDGEAALTLMRKETPRLLMTSPYLPKIMGIDLIASVREDPPPQPIIFLLGAIHSTRRFRRNPESLYGADDYLEEGISEESLAQKLMYHMEVSLDLPREHPPEDPEALRLARLVFTDLMVYNPDRMVQVTQVEEFFQVFKEEAAEGQRYIEENKPGAGNLLKSVVADYLRRQSATKARQARK